MSGGMKQTMNVRMGLEQGLRMTPQLQQAIKLLQLSRLELETQIRKEIEENPILEELAEGPGEEVSAGAEGETPAEGDRETQKDQDPQRQDELDWEAVADMQYKPQTNMSGGNEEIMNYENLISTTTSLYDHLMWQMRNSGLSEEEQMLVSTLISHIDDDGYLKTPVQQIAEDEGLNADDLESVVPYVQEFDPPGVGARDLTECLLIQAKHLQEDTHDLVDLIKNHLKNLEKKNYEAIAKAMNRPVGDVVEMCKIIYTMDPKPGRAWMPNETHYVTPDVYVYKVGDDYMVSLNEDGLPRLRISSFYKAMLQSKQKGDKTQEYIQDKLKSAVWLIKSIHQRQRTIFKVTESIVKKQRDFFERGPAFLRPMILRDIAEDIGMHESTVSRVTTAKYVHTPRGIFELKYFFNSGINTEDGDAMASESVKLKIKDLVSGEDNQNPLSDQKIVDLLKKEGIQIARRTVAKYRDVLKILPSSRRKKY
jgi:RNA polymerase sigma-54 factor